MELASFLGNKVKWESSFLGDKENWESLFDYWIHAKQDFWFDYEIH